MPHVTYQTAVESSARTMSGDSGLLSGSPGGISSPLRAQLNVTDASGTGTLDVVIEDSLDGSNFFVIGSFGQKTTSGLEVINVTIPFTDQLRVRWTIDGSDASFTFSVLLAQ